VIRNTGPAGKPNGASPVILRRGSDIEIRPYDWLWRHYLARRKLHLLAGAPGTGKTTIMLNWFAVLTVGGLWPDGTQAPLGDVLIWSSEDNADDTLIPRLALPVADIAADDCVLFLWVTAPLPPAGPQTMAAWGFTYITCAVWVKPRPITGYWFRNQHEILLVGTKGKVVAPAPGTQFSSVVEAPAGRHSEKPEVFAEMIEAYYPNLPKIELNRRGPARDGWDAWGNEAHADACAVEERD